MYKQLLITAATTVIASTSMAQALKVQVEGAWARGTVPAQTASGAFMKLTAPSDAQLVKASSTVAKTVEIHEMKMENDVMKMRAIDALALPAGNPVELKPGGHHIMLIDLTQQLKNGESFMLNLTFKTPDGKLHTSEVKVPIQRTAGKADDHKHHH